MAPPFGSICPRTRLGYIAGYETFRSSIVAYYDYIYMIYDDAYMYIDMRFRNLLRILLGRAKSAMCVDRSTKFGTHMTHTHTRT